MAGLYIHIPFCKQKCHYCDFHFSVSLRTKSDLIEALLKELEWRKSEIGEPVETIYFGGGTPSLLSDSELSKIFETIHKQYKIAKNPEITLEANPDDLNPLYLKNIRNQGVNRLSIGVQSFHDEELQMMNRVHTSQEAIAAIANAQDVGFENITMDLIYGFPNSNEQKWLQNLEIFHRLNIPHLSSYALTVEKKTALEHLINVGKIPAMDEQLAYNQFYTLIQFMKSNGFEHYELSNFAKPGFFSKHNVSYWQEKSYLGIGPSAHSYNGKTRSWNVSSNTKYISSLQKNELPLEREILSVTDRYNEYLMTGLRTKWGVKESKIENDFGVEYLAYFQHKVKKYLQDKKLVQNTDGEIVVSEKALFIVDGIISDLFWV